MNDGYIRVAAISPATHVANPGHNAAEAARLAAEASRRGARIAVFPELCLTSYTCGDLFLQARLLDEAQAALAAFIEQTQALDMLSVIGVPVAVGGTLYNCAAVIKGGRLLGLVPKTAIGRPDPFREGRYFSSAPKKTLTVTLAGQSAPLGTDLLFACRELPSLVLAVELGADPCAIVPPSARHAAAGATLLVRPGASPEGIGAPEARRVLVKAHSQRLFASYIYADAGMGESGTDATFGAHRMIVSHGHIVAEALPFADDPILTAEIDTDRSLAERRRYASLPTDGGDGYTTVEFSLSPTQTELSAPPSRFPFVPEDAAEREARCAAILQMQSRALATRIERSHAKTAILGVSGGLDSTLALLVAVRAMDLLRRDRRAVIAVTMPCFGTTQRTKNNAEALAEQLGTSLRCVDIKAAVTQHFHDIGQPQERYDVVYENAQARERTQVLMDIANAEGGLVVGTGDLSELALGWATYNGDHMSMYAVNAAVPKTLIRHIVAHCAEHAAAQGQTGVAAVLRDVLDTPVSPELLPPKDGEIAQCTEGIVGPYELHDYFLYYTLRFGFSPKKLLRLGTASFCGVYDEPTVRAWLSVFLRRFMTQQFKRSCLPDGPSVGSVSVSPRTELYMPSDADGLSWFSV